MLRTILIAIACVLLFLMTWLGLEFRYGEKPDVMSDGQAGIGMAMTGLIGISVWVFGVLYFVIFAVVSILKKNLRNSFTLTLLWLQFLCVV